MWTGDLEEDEGGEAAEERSERVVAMRDGTRSENATRLWGAIETEVNEDNVAPWNIDGMDSGPDSDGCVEPEEGNEGAGSGRGGAPGPPTLDMNDVTTATGCAVSRRIARIFWDSPRTLILLAARSKEDQRFAVASATANLKPDIMQRPGNVTVSLSVG